MSVTPSLLPASPLESSQSLLPPSCPVPTYGESSNIDKHQQVLGMHLDLLAFTRVGQKKDAIAAPKRAVKTSHKVAVFFGNVFSLEYNQGLHPVNSATPQ